MSPTFEPMVIGPILLYLKCDISVNVTTVTFANPEGSQKRQSGRFPVLLYRMGLNPEGSQNTKSEVSLFCHPEASLKRKSGSFPIFVPKTSQCRMVTKLQNREDLHFANPEGYPKHQSSGVILSERKGHYFSYPEVSRKRPYGKPLDH